MKLLKKLYRIYSPSEKEKKMREFLVRWAKQHDIHWFTDKSGNVFMQKGEAESYPCVVAHIDQVSCHHHSSDFRVVNNKGILSGWSQRNNRKEGLGADDKNGIWVALKCLMRYDTIKCAFFVGEEIGCVGSSACDESFFKDCRFIIQCDRKGNSDFISDITSILCSKEFMDDTHMDRFGYKATEGLSTDVDELKRKVDISMCNMSCGYYKPHTDEEYTVFSELCNCRDFVFNIIDNCQKVYPCEYESMFGDYNDYYGFYGDKDYYGDYYDSYYDDYEMDIIESDIVDMMSDGMTLSFQEFMGIYDESGVCVYKYAQMYTEILYDISQRYRGFSKVYQPVIDEMKDALKKYLGIDCPDDNGHMYHVDNYVIITLSFLGLTNAVTTDTGKRSFRYVNVLAYVLAVEYQEYMTGKHTLTFSSYRDWYSEETIAETKEEESFAM